MALSARGRRAGAIALATTLLGALAPATVVHAAQGGDASAAAAFVEQSQNRDGGFPEKRGRKSDPEASLWATVALTAAGKHPRDIRDNGSRSAETYLSGHLAALRDLGDLGLLATIQAASGVPAARYGDPGGQLKAGLTPSAMQADPGGAALGVLGLVALEEDETAGQAATTLATLVLADGGWGRAGSSDSASTALVLEALAQARFPKDDPAITRGIQYLHRAQVNDGSIATSDRTDASSSGDVAATAFTIQALKALRHPQLKTETGTTVRDGLTSYQQRTTGGLSPFGAYDTGVAPSVTQTAQAFPAFNGIALPLPAVAARSSQPKKKKTKSEAKADSESAGRTRRGVIGETRSDGRDARAFQGATVKPRTSKKKQREESTPGTQVSGSVVGTSSAPQLATRAGRAAPPDRTGLWLALALLALGVVGVVAESRRPTAKARRPAVAAVQGIHDFIGAARRRGALAPAAVVLVGAALIALPSATGMWSRAPQGADMVAAFDPWMKEQRIDRLDGHVATLDRAVGQAKRVSSASTPQVRDFARKWPDIERRFRGLLDPVRENRANYQAVADLPPLDRFPWFLLAPGALFAALGLIGIAWPGTWRSLRWTAAGLGAALMIAPLALGLLSTAPKGARMVDAFASIETRPKVTALQNDFGSLALGQGAMRTELSARVQRRLPAVSALNRRWPAVLGDFTPLLGVMSDNVTNYRAVAALPRFTVFPWLFAVPGALALLIGISGALPAPTLLRRRRDVPAADSPIEARSSA